MLRRGRGSHSRRSTHSFSSYSRCILVEKLFSACKWILLFNAIFFHFLFHIFLMNLLITLSAAVSCLEEHIIDNISDTTYFRIFYSFRNNRPADVKLKHVLSLYSILVFSQWWKRWWLWWYWWCQYTVVCCIYESFICHFWHCNNAILNCAKLGLGDMSIRYQYRDITR